jgi:hypothetical protein
MATIGTYEHGRRTLDMAKGAFVDKNHRPTMQKIIEIVGSKRSLWNDFSRFISEYYGMEGDLAFYGKNYGWAMRYRKGGKALVSIYPGNDTLTVQIVLGQVEAEKASDVFPEGRWLFIKVDSTKDLDDVKQLILIKSPRKAMK